MNKQVLTCFATALLSAASIAQAENTVYKPTIDFTIENGNPNGVWSYGWIPNDTQQFQLHTAFNAADNSLPAWFTAGCYDNTPQIWRNLGKKPLHRVAVGQLALHPGCQYEPAVLRWTAPYDGQYQITGEFFKGDKGVMRLGIRQNGQWLWNGFDAGKFNLTRAIIAGTLIDFIVYGGYDWGNTPLEVTITPVP